MIRENIEEIKSGLTVPDYEALLENLGNLGKEEQLKLLNDLERLEDEKSRAKARDKFLFFSKRMWNGLLVGYHHRKMAEKFEQIVGGSNKRIIINMPPRHGKSLLSSFLLPAWYLGRNPSKKVIQTSHTAELAVDFGRKVRNLIGENNFQSVFPGVSLSADSKAAGRWSTNQGGEYFAIGVGGAMAGKGADLLIIDDPHSEQEAKTGNPEIFDSAYEWYQTGPRQRLQPGASIVVVMTRWSKRDLTGRLIENASKNEGGDKWEVIELPMELPSGNPLWPEFWTKEDIAKLKGTLDTRYWQSQFQQNPTSEEGALIKREWWQEWEADRPPPVSYIILSLDTAHEKNNRADYSAFTVWGVFQSIVQSDGPRKGKETPALILLDAFKDRWEFPELKQMAMEAYKTWKPDTFIVEKKAAGTPLFQEFRRMGIPVAEYTPSKGQDKIARVNSVSDIFRSGMVWAPLTRWAEEVKDEVAGFPGGAANDDYVDSMTQAVMRFREGGFLTLDNDYYEDEIMSRVMLNRKADYY